MAKEQIRHMLVKFVGYANLQVRAKDRKEAITRVHNAFLNHEVGQGLTLDKINSIKTIRKYDEIK